jgi:hypothetical protein
MSLHRACLEAAAEVIHNATETTWIEGELDECCDRAREMRDTIDATVPRWRALAGGIGEQDARIAPVEERLDARERLCARQAELLPQVAARAVEAPAAAAA